MVKTFKIKYTLGGDIKVTHIKADDINQALFWFYMNYNCDDVISVVVEEDV